MIGTVLADPQAMVEAEMLLPSDFTGDHQAVWVELVALHATHAIDQRTLEMVLRDQAAVANPEQYLRQVLLARVGNIAEPVRKVMDAAVRRNIQRNAALIAAEAQSERETSEVIDFAEKKIMSLRRERGEGQSIGDILSIFMPRLEGLRDGTFRPAWVPHLKAFRTMISYAEDTDLIVIAARPGAGKSSYIRYEMFEDAKAGVPGLIFNYDNDPIEYARWVIAQDTGIDAMAMKNPMWLTPAQLEIVRDSARRIAALPLYIESSRGDGTWIGRTTRRRVHENGIKKMAVDYVQQVRNKGFEKPVDNIAFTMGIVRDINQQLRIPALVASQMNRSIETRGADDDGAKLSDLRDSGAIEQDATIVVFPKNQWVEPTEQQMLQFIENRDPRTGRAYPNPKAVPMIMEVKKNRNGDTGTSTRYKWVKSNNRFFEIDG